MTISIVLADDHPIVREGLRTLLQGETDFILLGEAGDGVETVRLVEELKPDVLILDMLMPKLSGLEVLPILRKSCPQTRVVVLSMYADRAFVVEALRGGALGYVLKGCETANLVRAIREAAQGRRFISSQLSERGIEAVLEDPAAETRDPHSTLTPREREVLKFAAEGSTNAQIAGKLFLSPRTVEMHRANLMRKLGLKTPTELVRYAIRRGIIPLQE